MSRRVHKAPGPPKRIKEGETLWLSQDVLRNHWWTGEEIRAITWPKGLKVTVLRTRRGGWGHMTRFTVLRVGGDPAQESFSCSRHYLTRVHCEPERRAQCS